MSGARSPEYLTGLVRELQKLAAETPWVEFKENNSDPERVGEYVSALANSAALAGKSFGYMVWGLEDDFHDVVGTTFVPAQKKIGNEELENWLLRLLEPKLGFEFHEIEVDGRRVVLLEIEKATHQPVRFKSIEYVRIGTYTKKLKDFPEKERELWRIFDRTPFEARLASSHVGADEVLTSLDYPAYFELLQRPLPDNRAGIVEALTDDGLIREDGAGAYDITNLGAVLFAKRLDRFEGLKRKAMRVIRYRGDSRVETVSEQVGAKGYASGFEGLIDFVNGLLPSNEVVGKALRRTVPMYPEIAIREIVANALIHQDFSVTGTGPMVEIFDGRLEVTSPGEPLIPTDRFVDTPPRSRNEDLASLMRRMGVCEERGSGIDKVVFQTELYQLPAPLFEVTGGATRVVLFSPKPLGDMDKADRIRACYLHACLRYVSREYLTNASLRERFGIKPKNSAKASRLIREAVEAERVLPHDPDASKKNMKYVPFWAAEARS